MNKQIARNSWQVILVIAIAFGSGAMLARAGLSRPIPDRATIAIPTAPGERAVRDIGEMLVSLESADIQDRSKAWQDLSFVQRTIVDRLVVILGKEKARNEVGDARQIAADLLKNCYSEEAVALLVQYIDYRGIGMRSSAESPYNGYPCAMTLRHYPHQATAAIFTYLAQTPAEKISPKANELYAWLFIGAYGRVKRLEPGNDATFLIDRAKDMAVGEDRKGNYQRLLDTVKELTKNWPD
jgi:hypothetical protein